jgi:hypothetical protein
MKGLSTGLLIKGMGAAPALIALVTVVGAGKKW